MAVFRIEKTRNFTTMSNHHFFNRRLSMKAKGVLSQLLSLPDDFTLTLKGLANMSRDGIDSIRSAVDELEREGYILRGGRIRNGKGELQGMEYIVRETPELQSFPPEQEACKQTEKSFEKKENHGGEKRILPIWENPIQGNPTLENPTQENPTLLNTSNNKNYIRSVSQYRHSNAATADVESIREELLQNAGLWDWSGKPKRDIHGNLVRDGNGNPVFYVDEDEIACAKELIGIAADMAAEATTMPTVSVSGVAYPSKAVIERIYGLGREHYEHVVRNLREGRKPIKNARNYLRVALFNAVYEANIKAQSELNYELHRDGYLRQEGEWI